MIPDVRARGATTEQTVHCALSLCTQTLTALSMGHDSAEHVCEGGAMCNMEGREQE